MHDRQTGGDELPRYRWVTRLTGLTLRELASLADAHTAPRLRDPVQAAIEIAEMLTRGTQPTIGWWRRHTLD